MRKWIFSNFWNTFIVLITHLWICEIRRESGELFFRCPSVNYISDYTHNKGNTNRRAISKWFSSTQIICKKYTPTSAFHFTFSFRGINMIIIILLFIAPYCDDFLSSLSFCNYYIKLIYYGDIFSLVLRKLQSHPNK